MGLVDGVQQVRLVGLHVRRHMRGNAWCEMGMGRGDPSWDSHQPGKAQRGFRVRGGRTCGMHLLRLSGSTLYPGRHLQV